MSTIHIQHIGITKVTTDCIVNAANNHLYSGGGVCGAIFKAAGYKELTAACRNINYCETGNAVVTPAFQLNTNYIIHAVGPIWIDGQHHEPELLYRCYQNALKLATERACHSIGFPLISSGIYGYPKKEAWETAIQACSDFINEHPDYDINIIFAIPDDNTLQLGETILNQHLKEEDLIKQINQDQLQAAINFFADYKKVTWAKNEKGGLSYPIYPKEAFEYIQLLPADLNYMENYDQYCKNIYLEDLNIHQIRTILTMITRKERFYDGFLAHSIEDGTILHLLERLDDILNEFQKNN